jgi:hypothetical protein
MPNNRNALPPSFWDGVRVSRQADRAAIPQGQGETTQRPAAETAFRNKAMTTPIQRALLIVGQGKNLTAEQIEAMLAEMEAEAFAAGERKGKLGILAELQDAFTMGSAPWNKITRLLERESKP